MVHSVWKTDGTKIRSRKDLILDILDARGIDDPEEFLKITKRKFHNPYKMRSMKPAVERIIKAVQNKEKIGIFGDYDARPKGD